jgi:hypothetical protein
VAPAGRVEPVPAVVEVPLAPSSTDSLQPATTSTPTNAHPKNALRPMIPPV